MPQYDTLEEARLAHGLVEEEYNIETDKKSFKEGLDKYIAERITNAMFSNDPEIKLLDKDGKVNTKATTTLLELLEEQDFYTHLKNLSQEASLRGVCSFLITSYGADTKLVPLSTLAMFLPIWDQYGEMVAIKLTRKISGGARPYFIQQTITKSKIISHFSHHSTQNFTSFAEFNNKEETFSGKDIPETQIIDMSKVPVALITNKPFSPSLITENPDLYFAGFATTKNAQSLMPRILHCWQMLGIELHRGRTILLSEDNSPDLGGQVQNKIESYNNYDMVNIIDGDNIQYVGGSFVGLEALQKQFKELVNEYFKRSFMSTTSNNAGKNQKNDLEIYAGSREEIQYIDNRCTIMQKGIKTALELFIEAYDKNPYNSDKKIGKDLNVVVNILTNEVRDSMQMAETFQNLYINGILPQDTVIKKILSIGDIDAQAIMEKQIAGEEAKMKREQKLNPQPATKTTPKPKPKGE